MGDMNDDPYNKSCAKVLNAKKKRDEVGKNGLFNPFWSILDKWIGTLAYKGKWNLFDQIIISDYFLTDNPNKLRFLKAEVLNFEFLKTTEGDRKGYPHRTFVGGAFINGYSDHFPSEVFFVREVPEQN